MITRQALVYGRTGQVVEMYPPESEIRAEGPPTAAGTWKLYGPQQSNDDTPLDSGSATLDATSTTVATTAAGYSAANRRLITLASTSGIEPRRAYCLANASKQREIVTPFEVASGYVSSENDLAYDYPITTSTFKGLRQYFTIGAAFIGNEDNVNTGSLREPPYRLRWTYTTGIGVVRDLWSYLDVVRIAVKHNVAARELLALFPDARDMEWREQRGQMFETQLAAAWDQFVFDITVLEFDSNQLREGPVVDQCVRLAALWMLGRAGLSPHGRDIEAFIVEARDNYKQAFAEAFKAPDRPKAYMDTGREGLISNPPARPFFIR